jgi:UDP-N-acetylmuramoylalanine--D-glutamate ligase
MQGGFGEGATTRGEWAGVLHDGTFVPVIRIEEIPLLGRHNVENVLAAMAMGDILGVAADPMAEGIASYRPAPHRLQTVSERGGVRYVDDSIATSPARASVALESIAAPVILIAGGRDKNLPWDDFARLAVHKVRALLLIGEAAPVIREAVERELAGSAGSLRAEAVRRCASLAEAVCTASRLARPGDVVLLSPGCASYDMFSDFEERGAAFVEAVEALDAA